MSAHEYSQIRKQRKETHTKEANFYNENLLLSYSTESTGKINALYKYEHIILKLHFFKRCRNPL